MRPYGYYLGGFFIGLLFLLFLLFRGGSGIQAKGRITRGGEPFRTGTHEGLRIIFEPQEVAGDTYNSYPAEYRSEDGSFVVRGRDAQGLPPGKYRVSIQLMKNKEDLFRGACLGKKSPFTCEVTDGSEEVLVDLDKVKQPAEEEEAGSP
jgi:hypothetical protein